MKKAVTLITLIAAVLAGCSSGEGEDVAARNKETARHFYEDLWFSENTDKYADYVAETYVVHDVGPRKGVEEEAVEQKNIADLFHSFGEMTGKIDYQIAEGDKVATRWWIYLEPNEQAQAMGITPVDGVAIINVFRFNEDGKIVEVWNHRHDVELPQPPGDRPDGL
ncbi:ester cyclase [Marinicaulis aureus]|uniref:Ester cyclase n=1 Tax=Hyphococcus aureus TaxID=2666033 RepID=A0ABW1L0U7_9PROT